MKPWVGRYCSRKNAKAASYVRRFVRQAQFRQGREYALPQAANKSKSIEKGV
jgi:hypothetical protein